MNFNGPPQENNGYRNDQDLRIAYDGRFIFPSSAENGNVYELNNGEIKIPVSFNTEAGRFRLSGIQQGSENGVIISGVISDDSVKINHIIVAETLRRSGISQSLLTQLENNLKSQNIKVAYATFGKFGTVDFFLKNGYEIISYDTLSEETRKRLDINYEDIEPNIQTYEDYVQLNTKSQENPECDSHQILLKKNLI